MKTIWFALALAAATAVAGTADAAVVTKRYEVTGTFASGSKSTIVTAFDVTFDPSSTVTGRTPLGLANLQSDGGAAFAQAVAAYEYTAAQTVGSRTIPEKRLITIDGNGVAGLQSDADDFTTSFEIDASGGFVRARSLSYSTAAGLSYFARVTTYRELEATPTTVTAAVPEPAIWAMMLLGFGMIGAALRHRRSFRHALTA